MEVKCLTALVCALVALPAHAQLYKWTDANGKVHYSDRPQDGATAKEIAVPRATPSGATVPRADDWRERERASRERQVRREQQERREAAVEAANAARMPYNPSMHKSDKPMTDDEVCTRDAQQIAYAEKAKRLQFNRGDGSSAVASEDETREIVRQRKENHALMCGPNQRRR